MVLNKITAEKITINQYSSQREIPFEKRDRRQTIVFTETELNKVLKIAESRGYRSLNVFLRKMVFIGIKYEKYLNATLQDILS